MDSSELSKRINRLIGQLKGIQKMSQEERECSDILQQISAVKKAIDGLSKQLILSNIYEYVAVDNLKKVGALVEQAINL